ncbi:transcriptional regulator, TrmB [Methanocella sp. CWC-04]|uniref:Transcriptional regulator, TrmB n=1 Tax=Methanooceanicella nereidis TaxID=2052831 RepID=A0AAP2RGZ8_9EURY|nr:MarR family transcriptional regulator [Methanocella sp. CWC-04]MCD1296005.1 transcriptional regulator, TrmB [Methanocella sp. CWC-04]
MTKTYSDILKERDAILSTFEALFKVRGLGPLHGRVFGAIMLSVDALTQDEIGEFTGYSVPAVSSALDDLVRVGLVYKQKRQDSRKNYYSSKADLDEIMKMILKTIHDDYVMVVLNRLETSKNNMAAIDEPFAQGHIEIVQNYEKELRDLELYLKRLLEVPLEEKK